MCLQCINIWPVYSIIEPPAKADLDRQNPVSQPWQGKLWQRVLLTRAALVGIMSLCHSSLNQSLCHFLRLSRVVGHFNGELQEDAGSLQSHQCCLLLNWHRLQKQVSRIDHWWGRRADDYLRHHNIGQDEDYLLCTTPVLHDNFCSTKKVKYRAIIYQWWSRSLETKHRLWYADILIWILILKWQLSSGDGYRKMGPSQLPRLSNLWMSAWSYKDACVCSWGRHP